MLELVFLVCSIVEGAKCKELPPITLIENTTMIGCVMASQIEAVRWVDAHPNSYVQRATCRPAGRFAKA